MTFAKHFWKNTWHLTLFVLVNIIVAFVLKAALWFWIVVGVWLVALIGSLIHYNKTIRK